jgi:hypothetical protein
MKAKQNFKENNKLDIEKGDTITILDGRLVYCHKKKIMRNRFSWSSLRFRNQYNIQFDCFCTGLMMLGIVLDLNSGRNAFLLEQTRPYFDLNDSCCLKKFKNSLNPKSFKKNACCCDTLAQNLYGYMNITVNCLFFYELKVLNDIGGKVKTLEHLKWACFHV